MKNICNLKYVFILAFFFLAACAQINELTGGSDDDYAPTIDSAKSFPYNGQLNFTGNKIELHFNEYISLIKPNDNILLTPRQQIAPTISAHNKTLEITFNEPLLENTTYTINFNRAIADITEKNDSIFQYVFSTGNYIDSLGLSGHVKDAFTNTACDGYLVALYPMTNEIQFDSVPYLSKPTYIGQSDKSGSFKMSYLKYGLYYLFAFEDKNKNLTLDPGENVAFLPEKSILVNSKNSKAELKSFSQNSTESKIQKVNFLAPGKLEVLFTSEADSFSISTSLPLYQEDTKATDSLIYWLGQNPTARMQFVTIVNGISDTLKPLYKISDVAPKLSMSTNIKEGKLLPDERLRITFSEPISLDKISNEKIRILTSDSVSISPQWEIENLRTLVLMNAPDKPLILQIDSAAATSFYGTTNIATLNINFENYQPSYFGSLIVNADSVFQSPVLVYLLDSKGNVVDTIAYSSQMKFDEVIPGDYQLRLVVDTDGNGEWTSGSLASGQIPEKVIYFNEIITIKSKWIKEVDWLLKGLNN